MNETPPTGGVEDSAKNAEQWLPKGSVKKSYPMLYPHPQKFDHLKCIFIHVPKDGGTSIERTLSAPGQIAGGHTTSTAYKRHFPAEWSAYFKFSIVRNPLDRFLSAYQYLIQHPIHAALNNQICHSCSFGSFLERLEEDSTIIQRIVHMMPCSSFLIEKDTMDKIYPFERLEESWRDICGRLGIDRPLPKLNPSKPISLSQRDADHAADLVGRLYGEDFEMIESLAFQTSGAS